MTYDEITCEPVSNAELSKAPLWEEVIVVTPTFHCCGYVDARGLWHRATDGSIIEDVICWLPLV